MTVRDRGRTLRWLATAVVVAGVLVSVAALVLFGDELATTPPWLPAAAVVLVGVATAAVVRVRLRSTVVGTAWTDAATLITIVILPAVWVPLCVGTGVLLAKLFGRVSAFRAAYNAGRAALAAAAGLAVAIALQVSAIPDPLEHTWQLAVVAVAVVLADYTIGAPVLALASGTPWHRVLRTNGDIRLASFVGKLAVAFLTFWLWQTNPWLVVAIVPVAFCVHQLYASQVRSRTERVAWQRLAATTEALNDTDLEKVAATAVVGAAKLFAADEAEVFVRDGMAGPLLVRGDADRVLWSGDPGYAPPRGHDAESITVRLGGAGENPSGELRLHYAGRVRLTERERLTLRTFASALQTALRNAVAFAEVRRLAVRTEAAARHDELTGLANRRGLQEYAVEAFGGPGVAALAVVDLDLFREFNETLGHVVGDRLLVEVGRRLARAVSSTDRVARLGADEFAVLLTGLASPADAEPRVRELLAALEAPVDLGGVRVRVEASAGIAVQDDTLADSPGGGLVELLRRADIAMYQAKRGQRVVRYQPDRDTADVARLLLSGDLPRAIAQREFAVHFQPIVDLATGQMIAAEALARWHHPDRGDLNPRRFLAGVERSGLLSAFAEAVLDQALAAVRGWRAIGVDAPVAVNASPRNLLDPAFPRMVADRLAAHGMTGEDLIIELTESLTMSQVEQVGGVLGQLRAAGVRLALDDFGTGSSSLALLAKVPAYELKIDRSFVAAMQTSPEAAAVVRSTIELGRSLHLLAVAEGVERPEQRRALWQLGCPAGQGHLFARPMTLEALLDLLRNGVDGVVGRLCEPMHRPVENVIDLPRARRADGASRGT